MDEIHIKYKEAKPVLEKALERTNRQDLRDFVEKPEFKHLFLHNVDHVVGYEDGGSKAQYERVQRRYHKLSLEQKTQLFDLDTSLMWHYRQNRDDLSDEEKKDTLLTANQLVQHTKMINFWRSKNGSRAEKSAKRISRYYSEDIQGSIPEWDAQISENKGFWHMGNVNGWLFGNMASIIPTFIGLGVAGAMGDNETAKGIMENYCFPTFMAGAMTVFADQYLMLPLQEIRGKSVTRDEGLVTNGHYKFMRHPLYGTRMLGNILLGIASLNPIGAFCTAKTLYHGTRACEEQDARLRKNYGIEAELYQDEVPAFIPGTKLLMKGLKRILPAKITDALESPISDYLSKIPFVAKEPSMYDVADARNPSTHYKMNVNFAKMARNPWALRKRAFLREYNEFKEAGSEMAQVFASIPRDIAKEFRKTDPDEKA